MAKPKPSPAMTKRASLLADHCICGIFGDPEDNCPVHGWRGEDLIRAGGRPRQKPEQRPDDEDTL